MGVGVMGFGVMGVGVMGVGMGFGVEVGVLRPESTNPEGVSVPVSAVKPTPCVAPAASVRPQSKPLITYCDPVWLTICAFQMVVIERL